MVVDCIIGTMKEKPGVECNGVTLLGFSFCVGGWSWAEVKLMAPLKTQRFPFTSVFPPAWYAGCILLCRKSNLLCIKH